MYDEHAFLLILCLLLWTDELAALTAHINELNIQRRQILNDFLDLKGNLSVKLLLLPVDIGDYILMKDNSNLKIR